MTKHIFAFRPAGAAIAAVLALSSTAGAAQDIVAPPTLPAPASAPTLVMPAPAPAPAVPAPVIVLPTPPEAAVGAPAAAEAPAAPVTRSAARQAARQATRPARPALAPAVRAVPPAAAPQAIEPVAANAPASVEFAPLQTVSPVEPESSTATVADSGRLDVGALGLIGGALAIGGIATAALVARRRRREPGQEPIDVFAGRRAAPPTPLAPSPFLVPAAGPVEDREPAAPDAANSTAPAAVPLSVRRSLAAGTATGHYARQAELGPTPENPFLTRRNRMRRAHFLDARAARESEQAGRIPADDWLESYRKNYRTANAR